MRIALYSHDAQGLGHVRRNLSLAASMAALTPRPDVLLVSGVPEAGSLPRPEGCDLLGLPSLVKRGPGRYEARHLAMPGHELRGLRAALIETAMRGFDPDLVVVDRHPRGVGTELEGALDAVAGRARVVLGLRDVLDDPTDAAREWREHRCAEALSRWYDGVWVYGDRSVHDPLAGLEVPGHLSTDYTGYLGAAPARHAGPGDPTVLAMVGGGSDGAPLATAFVRADLPRGHRGVLVLGPQMPVAARRTVRRAAAGRDDLDVHDFVADVTPLLDGAVAAVTMGGYNTLCELMGRGTPTLVVPRVEPRREQLVRARRLAALGQVDLELPGTLTPERLTRWLAGATGERRRRGGQGSVDLDGLARVRDLVAGIAAGIAERIAESEVADVAV